MKIAFYKGRGRLFDKLIRWWTHGPYSHVEAVFDYDPDSQRYLCAAASPRDGGVRFAYMALPEESWDILDVSFIDSTKVYAWFTQHAGAKYDWFGILGFVFPFMGQSGSKSRYYCSEAVLEASNIYTQMHPNMMANGLERYGIWIQHPKLRIQQTDPA